ncbi:MAG: YigZ family protein [Lachnospiraceae bacterium]
MLEQYQTIYQGGVSEIIEKKSRFIAETGHVKSEMEANVFIENIRKKHRDANHHCFAYVIGHTGQMQRCSDDGEPAKTAGRPILDVLMGEQLCDAVVVVTRYFGGTLLGTGGLVRAYTSAAQEGIGHSVIITKIPGIKLKIHTDYTGHGKIQYLLLQKQLTILNTVYEDRVCVEVLIPTQQKAEVQAELIEGTNGRATLTWGEECWYAKVNGAIKLI